MKILSTTLLITLFLLFTGLVIKIALECPTHANYTSKPIQYSSGKYKSIIEINSEHSIITINPEESSIKFIHIGKQVYKIENDKIILSK